MAQARIGPQRAQQRVLQHVLAVGVAGQAPGVHQQLVAMRLDERPEGGRRRRSRGFNVAARAGRESTATMARCGSRPRSTTRCGRSWSSRRTAKASPVTAERLADAQGIPQKFLQNILLELRRAGIVASHRGPDGGHALARAGRQDHGRRRDPRGRRPARRLGERVTPSGGGGWRRSPPAAAPAGCSGGLLRIPCASASRSDVTGEPLPFAASSTSAGIACRPWRRSAYVHCADRLRPRGTRRSFDSEHRRPSSVLVAVEAHGDELLGTPGAWPATRMPRTSCRTRCCARCGPIRGCAMPITCARAVPRDDDRGARSSPEPAAGGPHGRTAPSPRPSRALRRCLRVIIAPLPDGVQAALRAIRRGPRL